MTPPPRLLLAGACALPLLLRRSDAGASIVCGDPALPRDVLSTRCNGSCGDGLALCVRRSHAQPICSAIAHASCVSAAACSLDCVPASAAPSAWAIQWRAAPDSDRVAVAIDLDAPLSPATVTVLHDAVVGLDPQLTLPATLRRLSIQGPSSPVSPVAFTMSDATLQSFAGLTELRLARLDLSDWETLPGMPQLRSLSLVDVNLSGWPFDSTRLDLLETLSIDSNPLLRPSHDHQSSISPVLSSLSLKRCNLTQLPASITNISTLKELFIDGNPLLNATLTLPSSLTTLSARDCGLPSLSLDSLTSLSSLDLSSNPAAAAPLPTLPSSIQSLQLADCGLTRFPTDQIHDLPLTTLDLSHNALIDTDASLSDHLSAFTTLTTLDLSATKRSSVPAAVATLSQLTHLSLASNAIDSVDATSLPSALQHLNLAANPSLSLSLPQSLQSTLRSLNISRCSLASLSTVEPLAVLETLDASSNAISDASLVLPQTIQVLNLAHNQLTTLPTAIFKLTSLQELDLRGNPIAPGSVRSLRSSEVEFLHNLRFFAVDAMVFQSSNCTASAVTFSFGYTVCMLDEEQSVRGVPTQPRNPSSSSTSSSGHVSRNLYIVAVTVATALVLVSLLSVVLHRRNKNRDRQGLAKHLADDDAWPEELDFASTRDEISDDDWRAQQLWRFWDDESALRLRLPWDLVRDRQVIGSGQHSVLWLARVNGDAVFLKALQRSRSKGGDAAVALVREFQLLTRLCHEHIVTLVGVTWLNAPTDVQVVMEDCENGDLRGYLELTQSPAPATRWIGGGRAHGEAEIEGLAMRVALHVADALTFVHSRGVVHNDVRSRNVLLNAKYTAKLSGFGRHVFLLDKGDIHPQQQLREEEGGEEDVPQPSVDRTFLLEAGRWMAPELLQNHLSRRKAADASLLRSLVTPAVDVYAFGVLLLELDAFELPFARVDLDEDEDDDLGWMEEDEEEEESAGVDPSASHPRDAVRPTRASSVASVSPDDRRELRLLRRLASGRLRVAVPTSCPMGVGDLILQCVAQDPAQRPPMSQVRDALQSLADAVRQHQRQSRRPPASRVLPSGAAVRPRSDKGSGAESVNRNNEDEEEEEDASTSFFVMQHSPSATHRRAA